LGRIKELNLAPQIFDATVISDVLDYLSDPLNELLQINRLLKKGGFLMVRVLNRIHYALLGKGLLVALMKISTVHLVGTRYSKKITLFISTNVP